MKITCWFLFLFFLLLSAADAQHTALSSEKELKQLALEARTAYNNLEKLNEIRIRLREIEFDKLTTVSQQELYAEAYLQLAIAFRESRYIRPGYDIYVKYISLKDELLRRARLHSLDSVRAGFEQAISVINKKTSHLQNQHSQLNENYRTTENLRTHFISYCTLITLILVALFAFFYLRLRKSIVNAKEIIAASRNKIKDIYPNHTNARMYAGLITQLQFLNTSLHDDFIVMKEVIQNAGDELHGTKEVKSLLKNINDNSARIDQLLDINEKTLSVF
ncbi:MAG: hypothetical protein LC117_05065 [Bacteroidia bacterium]|nr:hypothetical protein [Bacteroidia bacterium]MCZ2277281.1 hypothetical protein [Bacteroidia bacterium]